MAVRCRPVKTRGYAISEAGGGAGVAGWAGAVCAGAGVWVAALARATCWRKVRRLVDIRYRVLWRAGGWGAGCRVSLLLRFWRDAPGGGYAVPQRTKGDLRGLIQNTPPQLRRSTGRFFVVMLV